MNAQRLLRVIPRRSDASLVLNQVIGSVMVFQLYPTTTGDRLRPLPGSDGDKESEFPESSAHDLRGHTEQAGDRPQVLRPDSDHPTVEVLAMDLNHREVPSEKITFGTAHRLQLGQVDGGLPAPRSTGEDPAGIGWSCLRRVPTRPPTGGRVAVGWQELIDRDVIEPGQALQPGHRDRPLPTLVSAEHRRLELLTRRGFHRLEGQMHLFAHSPEPGYAKTDAS